MKEVCICAAIKLEGGFIMRGQRHHDCYRSLRERNFKLSGKEVQGFITSKNRFVDRKEGYKLHTEAGIKSHDEEGYRGDFFNELFSEDLY